jgi:hypothetical protein
MTLMAALQLPMVLTKLSYLIDNPWAVSLDRAVSAGQILADSLIDRNLGTRPVTLVGYSLGSRVIFSCLQELAKKGAYGLVQNVYLFGSPVVVRPDEYIRARTVVSGRFVNGFNRNDWILGYLFRLTNGGIRRIAGLATIESVPGIENLDVTELVVGHMEYRTAMPRLLRECGWLVESDEFSEIEDPDPENHKERQRELINEIEEARKELEKEGKASKSGGFGFFGRKKKALERAEWEVYEDSLKKDGADGAGGGGSRKTEDKDGNNHGVLFDVDAIRAELAKEQLQVRELQSTLPPMKLDLSPRASLSPSTPPQIANPRDALRETRSADAAGYRSSYESGRSGGGGRVSQERTPTLPKKQSFSMPVPSPLPAPPPYSHHHDTNSRSHSRANSLARFDDDGHEEIQMTFDTSFHDPEPPPPPPPKDLGTGVGPQGVSTSRPELRSSRTVPNITIADPWADPDDEDFGKEKEIQMTFA